MKRVLVIEGGGIKGITGLHVLKHIESLELPDKHGTKKKQRISDLFDLVVGTSTGGIIAWALTVPQLDDVHTPANSATKVLDLYCKHGSEIFKANWFRRRWTPRLFVPKYSSKGLRRLVHRVLDGARVGQALTKVMTPAWDLTNAREEMFKSWREDRAMADAALATSAAPTFFAPHKANGCHYIDGGLFANDPSPCAIAEARRLWGNEQLSILVLDIGGGAPKVGPKRGGILSWVGAAGGLLMGSGQRYAQYLGETMVGTGDCYYRVKCHSGGIAMDDASDEAITKLNAIGREAVAANHRQIEEVMRHGL